MEEYLANQVDVFREVKRVLRDDGMCWLNIGDSYAGGASRGNSEPSGKQSTNKGTDFLQGKSGIVPQGLKPQDMCLIPERLKIALQADGWWVRSDPIWVKPNPMPESVNGWRWEQHQIKVSNSKHATVNNIKGGHKKMLEDAGCHQGMSPDFLAKYEDCPGCIKCDQNDGLILKKGNWRPTKSYEHMFLLTKSQSYWGDAEAVREVHLSPIHSKRTAGEKHSERLNNRDDRSTAMGELNPASRNLRDVWNIDNDEWADFMEYCEWKRLNSDFKDVWDIPTEPVKFAHFACFPQKLVQPCIEAATSERGCCPECGTGWVRVVEKGDLLPDNPSDENANSDRFGKRYRNDLHKIGFKKHHHHYENKTLAWRPACSCGHSETVPAVIFDPYGGSATTGLVARRLGRDFVMTELSKEYIEIALQRLGTQNSLSL